MYRIFVLIVVLAMLACSAGPANVATVSFRATEVTLPNVGRAQPVPDWTEIAPNCDSAAGYAPGRSCQSARARSRRGALQPAAAYTFTGSPIITPTIDGVFSGQFVDGDGAATTGADIKAPLSFVGLKLFDAADHVYWHDPSGSFTAWQAATMTLWLDGDDDGIFRTAPFTDAVIVGAIPLSGTLGWELDGLATGFPLPSSPLGHSPFLYNDVEFIYDVPSKANNRYDNGEDIYFAGQYFSGLTLVDSVSEFRGAQHLLVADPDNPLGPPIAHVYWEQDADYVYFHNDFLVDGTAPFYDFNNLAGDDGFIDGDGTTTANSGAPARIGIDPAIRRWFTPTDQVMWYDADQDHHWTPGFDALWKDAGDGVYSSATDLIILYTGGVLTDNLTATVVLNLATFEFVYSDDNGNTAWNSGEDIWALPGDETWDYNYFDNRIAWLIDGDGAATSGRGSDEPTRTDGDQWFDASDRVYFYDANADNEWTEGVDALWRDENGSGTYQAGTDTVIRADGAIPTDTAASMILLQRLFVDGNGAAPGAGSANPNRGRHTPFPFKPSDHVFWHDGDHSQDWTISDTLWMDDGDGIFGDSITDTIIISAPGFVSGTVGILLTPGAHWIGYDDGEVNFNGRYDPGEDIWASNSYFAFDDLEINANGKYDLGEDIYDRDTMEIWVYAEGDNTDARMGGNEYAPDREPSLRDIGFRVHLNGIRVDSVPPITNTRVISDYDAPNGIQAAAGWGPSRGFVGPVSSPADPAYGGLNRHYEYRIPRQGGAVGGVSAGLMPQRERESRQVLAILPDCHMLVRITWRDVKRRNSQGWFVSSTGNQYPTADGAALVWEFFVHPLALPALPQPKKNDLNDPYWPGGTVVPLPPGEPQHFPADSFFDVFFTNPFPTEILQMQLTGNSPLGNSTHVLGAQTSDPRTQIIPGFGAAFATVLNLPPGGWVQLSAATTVQVSAPPGAVLTNTVNITATTSGGSQPTGPGGDSVTFNPPITITVVKTANVTTTTPGEWITYTIVYENRGPLPLYHVKITDTLPVSFTPKSGWAVDSFDITYRIDLPDPLPVGGRGKVQIAGVVSPTVQPRYWLTNTVQVSFDTALSGALYYTATNTVWVTDTMPVSVPPSSVNMSGPTSGLVNTLYTFTATVSPVSTTLPITYVWKATGQSPVTRAGGLTDVVTFSWPLSGTQAITLTATNAGRAVTDTRTINITQPPPGAVPPSGLTINGPRVVRINTPATFTMTIAPLTATQPFTYKVWAPGQPPLIQTNTVPIELVSLSQSLPGPQMITATASNSAGTVTATHAVTVHVPLNSVTLDGPAVVNLNQPTQFTMTLAPLTATQPYTYAVWAPGQPPLIQTNTVPIELVSLSLTSLGPQVITATASNVENTVTHTHAVMVVAPVSNVTIDGPTSGLINVPQVFTATVSPPTATAPITYVWQATGQSPVTHTGNAPLEIVSFTLTSVGPQTITVTALNLGGTVSDTRVIAIEPHKVYLPIVMRN